MKNDKLPPDLVEEFENSNIIQSPTASDWDNLRSMFTEEAENCAKIAVNYSNKQNRELVEVVKKLVSEGYKLKSQHNNPKWKQALENAEQLLKQNEI